MEEEKEIKFKALGKTIIVKAPQVKQDTKSGIFKGEEVLKEERKLKENTYLEVLAIGEEVTKVNVGNLILVSGVIHKLVIDDIECGYLYEPSVVGIKLD